MNDHWRELCSQTYGKILGGIPKKLFFVCVCVCVGGGGGGVFANLS